jgi:hypothetical protein
MNKTVFTAPLVVVVALFAFSGTALAHDGESHDKSHMMEEGSGIKKDGMKMKEKAMHREEGSKM